MRDILMAVLEWSADYKQWKTEEWNATNVSLLLMFVFTFVEVYGIAAQALTIRHERNGDAVSNKFFLYSAPFYLTCAGLGYHTHSLMIIFNAVVTAFALVWVLWELYRFKGFTPWDCRLGLLYTLMPVVELVTERWGWWYSACSMYFVWSFAIQLWELFWTGKRGAVEIKLFWTYLTTSVVWVVFAYTTKNWFLLVSIGGCTIFITLIMVLWYWYWFRDRKALR